ncbi:MAG: 1-acyl-sn-glycerol-3-phosphate acyltransferase [Lentisphaeria bacterium]|nr:1-acyl-sn-glycerol-3-phosphate acyltransferase [Candidatus Neomarinimicrobiota bacterium]MCF7842974.1 1-acyl-sn-glycerol-3-phosphate acyltransferase [Lentisphaeria bacterium]
MPRPNLWPDKRIRPVNNWVLAGRIALFIFSLVYFLLGAMVLLMVRLFSVKFYLRFMSYWVFLGTRVLMTALNAKIKVENGDNIPRGKSFVVIGNHTSYLDIPVVASQIPVLFVAKQDVKQWPLIGWAGYFAGTIFVDRDTGGKSGKYIQVMRTVLGFGTNIIFYPEGTTTGGEDLLRFRSALFAAAATAGVPVLPVGITYTHIGGIPTDEIARDLVMWYKDDPFLAHFLTLLRLPSIGVTIRVGNPTSIDLNPDTIENRQKIAAQFRDQVAALYHYPFKKK